MDPNAGPLPDRWSARELWAPLVVFVVTAAAVALPYWTATYDSVRDDGIFGSWHLVVVILVAGTFLAAAVTEVPVAPIGMAMLGCAPIAVVGRILIDTVAQPGSHDLWPLEIALAAVMSVPAVGVGAGLAVGVRRLSPRRPT